MIKEDVLGGETSESEAAYVPRETNERPLEQLNQTLTLIKKVGQT